jgi:hypothetical protein
MFHSLRASARGRAISAAAASALTVLSLAVPLFSADLRLDYKPAAYAIVGATVVTGKGEPIAQGTVVVRDGVIEAVGPAGEVKVPFDAETIDGKGLHVYPGFLDLFTTLGQPQGAAHSRTGEGRSLPYADYAYPRTPADNRHGITPEYEVAAVLELAESLADDHRRQGFTDLLAAPSGAIAAGQSALASLSGLPRREAVVKAPVALHIALRNPGGFAFIESQACADDDHPDVLEALAREGSSAATQEPAVQPPPSRAPAPGQGRPAVPHPRPRRPGRRTPLSRAAVDGAGVEEAGPATRPR